MREDLRARSAGAPSSRRVRHRDRCGSRSPRAAPGRRGALADRRRTAATSRRRRSRSKSDPSPNGRPRSSRGELTSRELVERYLQRIESLDRTGPTLRAVLETNPDALDIAASLDAERRAGKTRGPMHGIPVLVKDNIDTADRMHTTAGSEALVGARRRAMRSSSSDCARRARSCSARRTSPSGRTSAPRTPRAAGRRAAARRAIPTRSIARPRGRARARRSPRRRTIAPSPSARRPTAPSPRPSAACSLVGLKPTVGLVSRSGIVPISHTQDTAGPMCRSVADAAVLLAVLAGADPRDAATRRTRAPPTTSPRSTRTG